MKKKGKLGKIIIIVVVVIVLAAIFGGKGKSSDKDPTPVNNTTNTATQENTAPNDGKIDGNTNEAAEPEHKPEQPSNTADNTKDPDYISPELKEFLEAYEAFVDEYCEFAENYDSSNAAQLIKYASLMQKYSDFAKKVDAYDESTMTDAETIYYAETLNRISIKLMKASQNIH